MSLFDLIYERMVLAWGDKKAQKVAGAFAFAFAVAFAFAFAFAFAVAFAFAFAFAGAGTAVNAGTVTVFILTFFGVLNLPELIILAPTVFILGEIFFWTSKKKPSKNENTLTFTLKQKAVYFAEALFWIIQLNGILPATKAIGEWLNLNSDSLQSFALGTGILLGIISIGFIWLKINEQKFKGGKRKWLGEENIRGIELKEIFLKKGAKKEEEKQ